MRVRYFLLLGLLSLASVSFAQDNGPRDLGARYYLNRGMVDMVSAREPWFPWAGAENTEKLRTLLFSFAPGSASGGQAVRLQIQNPAKVVVAFAFENFAVLHPMVRNEKGVFLHFFDLKREVQEKLEEEGRDLEYRYVVDGVWMADPANPVSIRKLSGVTVSAVPRGIFPALETLSPEIAPEAMRDGKRRVVLRWKGRPGQEISVCGTFNNFDPYLHTLSEVTGMPGLYQIELRLRPGQHFYYYVVDGVRTLDPLNARNKGWSGNVSSGGGEFSRIDVPNAR